MNQLKHFLEILQIDELSATPKYKQLVNAVLNAVKQGKFKKGDMLPSINEISFTYDISRVTVEKGYNELRKLGVIEAFQGKGYFVANTELFQDSRIFLMFNKLSAHKKLIYDSFVRTLGDKATIDFYIYNNDAKLFCKIVDGKMNQYSHYVIIPHFIEGEKSAIQALNAIPKNKLILLDKLLPDITGNFGAVYENFSKDIYQALFQAIDALQRFSVLKLIFPENSYYPNEILEGFTSFCQSFVFEYKIVYSIKAEEVNIGEVYINLMEDDLFELLEKIEERKLKVGQDIGIISYNETKSKKFIMNGLTTVSTDFESMGVSAAQLILENSKKHIENPFKIVFRSSLI